MSEGFRFRQFEVRHDRCAMKVGTDGVLLGAWARGGPHILDVGTGTGIVALMMAQRYPLAHIDGVEIDAEAATQATDNAAASPFAQRVHIHHAPFQQFRPLTGYDAIVTNPPFFLSGEAAPDTRRATARHAPAGFFHDLFVYARRWLSPGGEVSLILPADVTEAVATEAYLRGFMLARRLLLRTVPRREAERCLVSFCQRRTQPAEVGTACLLQADGRRSEWYKALTADFYL